MNSQNRVLQQLPLRGVLISLQKLFLAVVAAARRIDKFTETFRRIDKFTEAFAARYVEKFT